MHVHVSQEKIKKRKTISNCKRKEAQGLLHCIDTLMLSHNNKIVINIFKYNIN